MTLYSMTGFAGLVHQVREDERIRAVQEAEAIVREEGTVVAMGARGRALCATGVDHPRFESHDERPPGGWYVVGGDRLCWRCWPKEDGS